MPVAADKRQAGELKPLTASLLACMPVLNDSTICWDNCKALLQPLNQPQVICELLQTVGLSVDCQVRLAGSR